MREYNKEESVGFCVGMEVDVCYLKINGKGLNELIKLLDKIFVGV